MASECWGGGGERADDSPGRRLRKLDYKKSGPRRYLLMGSCQATLSFVALQTSSVTSIDAMKVNTLSILAALAVEQVAAHATFQQLWVNGQDLISPPLHLLLKLSLTNKLCTALSALVSLLATALSTMYPATTCVAMLAPALLPSSAPSRPVIP
jgi:hypothetical protein